MTDVIFNGSSGRKPVGQASIELVFDNSEGTITGEYAGYAEISVKRKVTREGHNFYYLNASKCRRRDITDIFLGTGLGPRSYAIIEQGMISRLIEAKPEELRVYIEEAAGISKYKERRRETENRMNRTRENLERLTDIRDELERQLSRLERQALAAEKYGESKKRERELKSQLQALRYLLLAQESDDKSKIIRDLELTVEASVTEQVHHDTAIEKHRTEYSELGDKFNQVQGRFYSIGADVARIEQTIQHANERERQYKVDLEQVQRDCEDAESHLIADKRKAEGWQAELLEIEPELETIRSAEEESSEILMEAEQAMHVWQQEWDHFNQKAAAPRQQAEVEQSRIKYLEQVQHRVVERIGKLEKERDDLIIGDVKGEIDYLDELVAELALSIDDKNTHMELHGEGVHHQRDTLHEQNEQRDVLRSELRTAKGRLASLEALQQAALGVVAGGARDWLEAQGLAGHSRLAEKISVSEGWNKAAEVVLGKSLQAVCAERTIDDISAKLNLLACGEVMLLDCQGNSSTGSTDNSLSSKIQSDTDLSGLLGGVQVANGLAEALVKRSQLLDHQSVVTKDGLWFGRNWVKVIKEDDENSGIIARKEEIDGLGAKIVGLESRIETLSRSIAEAQEALRQAEINRDKARQESDELGRKHSEVKTQLGAKKAKVELVLEGRERAERDIKESQAQLSAEGENLAEARIRLQDAITAMAEDTNERENLLSRRDQIRAGLDEARQRARHDKDKAHALAMRHQSVKTQRESVSQGIQRLEEQMLRMAERQEGLKEAIAESCGPAVEYQLELEACLEKRVVVEQQLSEARREMEEAETLLRDAEKKRTQVEQVLSGLRTNLESARLDAQTIDVKRQNLRQQLAEKDLDVEEVAQELDPQVDESELVNELEKVANRIARLGPINLAAIDEFKTESERKHYLDMQNDDLQEALETLEGAIKKIDRETRTRFKETFDQVNSGLQELFPKVFGGGHAYLELTGEDLLDTGIAIMARPPGKKNSTIHLLSGGEKALTAIALVFSIFRLNPAPFCMLDEVDAPLDDANVSRYARMVEEMATQVQFIYITHNKIAMEMAHRLLGVTMHEPGVSRMVTVDVDEAAELAAS